MTTTPVDLAAFARGLLSSAHSGRLVLRDGVRGRVGVLDEDGEPVLVLDPGSADAAVAHGATARLEVETEDGVLVIGGRLRGYPGSLRHLAPCCGGDRPHRLVTLSVDGVHVRVRGVEHTIALDSYACAEPDRLHPHLPGLVAHLREGHLNDVLALARLVTHHEALGAAITGLDAGGVTVDVVTIDGATRERIGFTRVVTDIAQLRNELVGLIRRARSVKKG